MVIEQLNKLNGAALEIDDDRLDVNANVTAPYITNEITPVFENLEGISCDLTPLNSEPRTTGNIFGAVVEYIRELAGNYISNEAAVIPESDAAPSGTPETNSQDDGFGAVADAEERIADQEFRLDHGGLSRRD